MDVTISLKDKRTGVACEECRRRKRKCDGQRPKCTLCSTLKKACDYAGTVETRKRKQWSNEYVSGLEDQVASLKEYIQDLEGRLPYTVVETGISNEGLLLRKSVKQDQNSLSPDLDDSEEHVTGSNEWVDFPRTEDSVDDKERLLSVAVDEIGALIWKMNIGDSGEPAFTGPSGNFCFPSSHVDGTTATQHTPNQSRKGNPEASFEVCSSNSEMKHHLIHLFMTQINPLHQFLQPSTLLSPDTYPSGEPSTDLLHSAVFAAGACFSEKEFTKESGRTFAKYAQDNALGSCKEQQSIVVVQALNILAWMELSQGNDNMAWIYNSMAAGLAVGLGLHVIGLQALSDPTHTMIHEEKEARLRTFWAFFLMDRMATSILGRYCTIPWRRVDVPTLDTILTTHATIDEIAFDQQCKLWFLHDQFMDQIYAFEFMTLESSQRSRLLLAARNALLTFRRAVPQALNISTSTKISTLASIPRSALFFQMSYQMSLLLIHRPYLRESPESTSFRLALNTMTVAASNMTRYIQLDQKHYAKYEGDHAPGTQIKPPAPPFVIHHILTASIMHLLNGTSNDQSHKSSAKRKLQICMEALSDLQSFWKGAGKAIAQIQDLAQRWRVVGILPMRFSMPVVRNVIAHPSNETLTQNPKFSETIIGNVEPSPTEYFLQQPRSDLFINEEGNNNAFHNYDLESIFQEYTTMSNHTEMGAITNDGTATRTEYDFDQWTSFDFDLALQDLNSFENFSTH